ncbi:MAG: DNA repair protein RecO [Chloroflexi bacterium]|jgi:DNA repair protein RecO (recombination protein O)|nr:DNA repair protein RecO [Chloroflexota bacterium]
MPTERIYRTHAVVLRRHNIGEADRVLTLFTPTYGKVRAVAKGVRRMKSRLAGHVELFSRVDVLLAHGRSLDIVTQAEVRDPFRALRGDLWKAAYASYVAELVDRFAEERHDGPESRILFDVLVGALGYFDRLGIVAPAVADGAPAVAVPPPEVSAPDAATGPAARLAARAAELKVLGALGYAPELYVCVRCMERLEPVENAISASAGGTLCPRCARGDGTCRHISVSSIKAMRLLRTEPFAIASRLRLDDRDLRDIELALRAHLAVTLERSLRTTDVLDRLRAALPRDSAGE